MRTPTTGATPAPETKGAVLRASARSYDLHAWLLTLGRERAFRERLADLARVARGETVLDVGCGTGSLAVAAARRVGGAGAVHGIDASPEMIAVAARKAEQAGVAVAFQVAVAEALPFPDATFDVVLSTLMLHHLPRAVREQCAREIRRVLKPGGRVLAVDFVTPARERTGLLARVHRHGHVALGDVVGLLGASGLAVTESGAVGVSDLHFALAVAPGDPAGDPPAPAHVSTSLGPLPRGRWVAPVAVGAVLVGHGLLLRLAVPPRGLGVAAGLGLAAVLAVKHLGFGGALYALRRRPRRPRA